MTKSILSMTLFLIKSMMGELDPPFCLLLLLVALSVVLEAAGSSSRHSEGLRLSALER